jgi:hypothetical protein
MGRTGGMAGRLRDAAGLTGIAALRLGVVVAVFLLIDLYT